MCRSAPDAGQGEEATAVGSAAALDALDMVFAQYREQVALD
jgi:TPP-dependent pyruvate/acetoin dehydrogenase alpha subunit